MHSESAPRAPLSEAVFFLHIAKTGGSTIKALIQNQFSIDSIFPGYYLFDLKNTTSEELGRYKLFMGHFPYSLSACLPHRLRCITFLRDPLERTLSHLEFIRREVPHHPLYSLLHDREMSFADIIKHRDLVPEIRNWQLNAIAPIVPCDSIFKALRGSSTPMEFSVHYERSKPRMSDHDKLELAKSYLDEFFFVGITDRMAQGLQVLSYLLRAPPMRHVQSLNIADRRTRRHELPEDVIAYIEEQTFYDRQLYDYAAGLFERNYAAMVDALVEQDYTSRFASVMPVIDRACLDFGEKLHGIGWHQREISAGKNPFIFRWTGPGVESTLYLRLNTEHDFLIEMRIVQVVSPVILNGLYFSANGAPLETSVIVQGEEYVARARISGLMLRDMPFSRLGIHVSETLPLSAMDPSDQRKVGVAVRGMEITPL